MSAIWGTIDFACSNLDCSKYQKLHQGYQKCKIDYYRYINLFNCIMGNELQYINEEDRHLPYCSPIYDEDQRLFFNGEGTLDNRYELLNILNADQNVSDSYLMYLGYKKWGIKCLNRYRGVFSFCVYHKNTNVTHLCVDQFSNHCLFYHFSNNKLFFSTMLFPLANVVENLIPNDRWLLDTNSVVGPVMMCEPKECAFQDVYKVCAGTFITINNHGDITETRYWDPVNTIKVNDSITDNECRTNLRKLLSDAVSKSIRTEGNVGIKLSSGLDSTTIAGFAAQFLAKQNKTLYGFTSVPLKDFIPSDNKYLIFDETPGVLKLSKLYPNINNSFIDTKGQNILNQAKKIVEEWELPCKSHQNAVWISEISNQAQAKNCKVLLSGATGNTTISAGNWTDYIIDLLTNCKFRVANKTLKKLGSKYKQYGRKQFAKTIIKKYYLTHKKKKDCNVANFYKNILIREDIGEKNNISLNQFNSYKKHEAFQSFTTLRNNIYILKAYPQLGEIETKMMLHTGISERDPLRNVELIEFLLSLPMRCFVNEKFNRRLVREFMDGIVPEDIRFNVTHRGQQSADNAFRIKLDWNNHYEELYKVLHNELSLKYLDKEKIDNLLNSINASSSPNVNDYEDIINAYTLSLYLQQVYNISQKTP